MSAIYGLVRLDGRPVEPDELQAMRKPMAYWGPDGGGEWREGCAGLGQLVALRTPEDEHEAGPIALPGGVVVTPAGRIDNRDELLRELGVPSTASDGALIARAYERWGDDAPKHLLGDWSFAAWNPDERRLFLARDHYGNTAVYYHRVGGTLAFASSLKGLLALPHVTRRLDELQLARSLVVWPADGGATMYDGVRRLPTAHALSFDAQRGLRANEYWSLLDVPEVRLASDGEYVEGALDLLGVAVRARMRRTGPPAAALSAGLDSSTVAGLAARESQLVAYTARPAHPEAAAERPHLLVDEWSLAELAAARSPNVEHVAVDGRHVTPLAAIEQSLDFHDEPEHATPNLPWVHALLDAARERGANVLLTGQMGNGSFSWSGDPQRVLARLGAGDVRAAVHGLRHLRSASRYGWAGALWHGLVQPARRYAEAGRAWEAGWQGSLANTAFLARTGLRETMRQSGWDPAFTRAGERERRLSYLLPGRLATGAWWHQRGAAQGVEMRDPTADVRLLEFCVGVPDEQFARDGDDRWLARRVAARVTAPEIAWNRRRGAQGADIAYRLRADAAASAAAVERIAASETAREYVDVTALSRAWQTVAGGGSEGAVEVTRGLAVGLFLLRLAGG